MELIVSLSILKLYVRVNIFKNVNNFKEFSENFTFSALHEKCPKTEFFLVCIFLCSDLKKLRIWTLFTQCKLPDVQQRKESAAGTVCSPMANSINL